MKTTLEILKAFAIAIGIGFALFGSAIIIGMIITKTSPDNLFADDYVKHQKEQLDLKITAFKDSCLKQINNPVKYNRFVDSANKYSNIYNYLRKP